MYGLSRWLSPKAVLARLGGSHGGQRHRKDLALDDVVHGTKAAFDTARRNLHTQQEAQLRRCLDVDGEGRVNAIAWTMDAPDGSRFHGELPLVTLSDVQFMDVRELTVEVDCTVERRTRQGLEALYLIPQDITDPPRPGTHRLKIAVSAETDAPPDVTLDGTPLTPVETDGSDDQGISPASDGTHNDD